jgi:hypothetical protein
LNRAGRLASTRRDEAAAVAYKKIPYIVRAMIFIDDRSFRRIAHPASAEQVNPEGLFNYGIAPRLFGSGSVE